MPTDLNITWYLLPLAAAISLVYSASRYELPGRILSRSLRLWIQIMIFMIAIFALLYALNFGL